MGISGNSAITLSNSGEVKPLTFPKLLTSKPSSEALRHIANGSPTRRPRQRRETNTHCSLVGPILQTIKRIVALYIYNHDYCKPAFKSPRALEQVGVVICSAYPALPIRCTNLKSGLRSI